MAVSGKPDRGGPATLITVAPTGAEVEKSAVPALPVTLEELVTTGKDCQAAGAAIIHVHIRDADAKPTLDIGRLTDTVSALRESTDLIVQLSTGGAVENVPHRSRRRRDDGQIASSVTRPLVNTQTSAATSIARRAIFSGSSSYGVSALAAPISHDEARCLIPRRTTAAGSGGCR